MRFTVTIDDKAWAKFSRRLERKGIAGQPAEVLEALIATTLTSEDPIPTPTARADGVTSTSIMMVLGRIKVEQVPDQPRDELSARPEPGAPPT